jgi:hypothetical protein
MAMDFNDADFIVPRLLDSPEALAELFERLDLFVTGDTRHDVTGQATGELFLHVFQIQFFHKGAGDGGECVAVEIREWCQSVTLPADFDRIEKTHLARSRVFPECHGIRMSIGGRPMMSEFLPA